MLSSISQSSSISADIKLKLSANTDNLEFEYESKQVNIQTTKTEEIDKLVYQAAKTIRRFSHYKNKAEIIEYVRTTMQHEDSHVFCQSIGVLKTTYEGIRKFVAKRKEKSRGVGSDNSLTDESVSATDTSSEVE